MATPDVGATAERLFVDFIVPLVVGGTVMPGRPIGAKMALLIGDDRPLGDIDKVAHVALARVRVARRLAPVDRFDAPRAAEWALAAALHDLVQTTHPSLKGALRPRAPRRLLELVLALLERVPSPSSVLDALSRHSIFSRMLEMARTDTTVSWWIGSSTFLGTEPPARLRAWPELRRVNVTHAQRTLMALPAYGGAIDLDDFEEAVRRLLAKTPVTDLATAGREAPRFVWTPEALGLVTTPAGRTLVVRALSRGESAGGAASVDEALGRATRALLAQQAWRLASLALDVLAERALAAAQVALGKSEPPSVGQGEGAFARAAGASMARRWIAMHGSCFHERERAALLHALEPAATSRAARELEQLVAAAVQANTPDARLLG